MRFKFCGDLDCPDWILAEIATLSKLTSVKIKLLCSQVVGEILGRKIDYEKVKKITADAKFDYGAIKACIAAVSFILTSAAKHSTEESNLFNELQQLGLPKEHSSAICKVYADNYNDVQEELKRKSLRLSSFQDMQWRLDYVLGSSYSSDINEPMVHLKFKVKEDSNSKIHTCTMTDDKFRVLLHELKEAYQIMENLE